MGRMQSIVTCVLPSAPMTRYESGFALEAMPIGCAAAISCEARSPSGPANHVLRRYPARVGVIAMSIMSLPGPVIFVSTKATANAPALGSICEAMLHGEAHVSGWKIDHLQGLMAGRDHVCTLQTSLTSREGRRERFPCPCLRGYRRSQRVILSK